MEELINTILEPGNPRTTTCCYLAGLILLNIYAVLKFVFLWLYYNYNRRHHEPCSKKGIGLNWKYYVEEKMGELKWVALTFDIFTSVVILFAWLACKLYEWL